LARAGTVEEDGCGNTASEDIDVVVKSTIAGEDDATCAEIWVRAGTVDEDGC